MKKLLLLVSLLTLMSNAYAINIVNGDFEGNNLSGWTTVGGVSTTTASLEGTYSALMNSTNQSMGALDTFFGLSSGTFSGSNLCAPVSCVSGAAMKQTITAAVGDIIDFDFLPSLENNTIFNDAAVVILQDTIFDLGDVSGHYSYEFTAAGTYEFGFALINGGDSIIASLTVDNITTNATDIPAPASLALFGLGLLAVRLSRTSKK